MTIRIHVYNSSQSENITSGTLEEITVLKARIAQGERGLNSQCRSSLSQKRIYSNMQSSKSHVEWYCEGNFTVLSNALAPSHVFTLE